MLSDRWRDAAYRLKLRLTGGRALWHNRDFPPSLEVTSNERDVTLAQWGKSLHLDWFSTLEGQFDGRCFIVMSGPSVGTIDGLERVAARFNFWANGSPALAHRLSLTPSMYVVSDPGFATRQRDTLIRYSSLAQRYLISLGVARRVIGAMPANTPGFLFEEPGRPFRAPLGSVGSTQTGFAQNQLAGHGTVALICVHAALRMGFREIVLFGLDLTDQPRFFQEGDAEPSRLIGDTPRIVAGFQEAMQLAAACGARLVNCSPGTALPATVVPHGDPEQWL